MLFGVVLTLLNWLLLFCFYLLFGISYMLSLFCVYCDLLDDD